MKVVSSADWRDGLPFETPTIVSTIAPGDPATCATCGPATDPRPRTELWAIKHRHPNNHSGFVQFSCADHVLTDVRVVAAPPVAVSAKTPAKRRAPSRASAPVVVERPPRAACPDCFVEATATGVCSMCGAPVPGA